MKRISLFLENLKGWKTASIAWLGLLLCFLPVIVTPGLSYYYWGDETRQVIPLTISLWRDIRSLNFGTWDFSMSFGASNAIHFLSYLGSPSFWLLLLLPKAEWIIPALPVVTMLSMAAAALFSYLWLSDLTEDEPARLAGTMIMTFSGWVIFWQHYYSYVDAWMYLCLLLYIMEEVLHKRKLMLFPVVIALLTILDFFTLFMASWLILFYMVTRLFMRGLKFNEVVKALIRPFLLYLLGLGMAGLVFLSDVSLLLASSRVNTGVMTYLSDPGNLFLHPEEIYRLFTSLFSPVINDYDYNIFSSPFVSEKGIHAYAMFSYSFILFPLLFPQVTKVHFEGKKPLLVMMGFLAVCAFVPDAYVLFNGNTNSRWCFYLIVFHVVLLACLITNRRAFDAKLLKFSATGVSLLLVFFSLVSVLLHLTTPTNLLSIALLVPLLILFSWGYFSAFDRHGKALLVLVLLAEGVTSMYARMINGKTVTIGKGERALFYERGLYDTAIIDKIKSEDNGFYRISSNESTAENYLLPMAKDYDSSSFYFSIYNNPSEEYYHARITENWFIPYLPSKFLSYGVLGNRYLLSYRNEPSFVPAGYEKIMEETSANGEIVDVYRNRLNTGLGFASDRLVSQKKADAADRSLQDYLLAVSILSDRSDEAGESDERFVSLGEVNNAVLDHAFSEPGTLFLDSSMIEPDAKGSYELYRNGEVLRYGEFEEYGFYALRIEEACDGIGVYARNRNFEAEEIPMRLYWLSDRDLDDVIDELNSLDRIEDVSISGGRVKGKITITGGTKVVAASIPWNRGWRVYADGVEIPYERVNTSFIGFDLPEGSHELLFVYTPEGWAIGKWISAASLLLYALLAVRAGMRGRKSQGLGGSMV